MTALATAQLDELERKAIALTDAPVAFHKTESGSEAERMAERDWRRAAEDFRHVVTPAAVHRLVTIARAALAWSEAHNDLQGAHYMAVAGADPGPARERYGQAIAALQRALEGEP